ncbi:MAG: thermonuclease family protein [Methylococcales bacterium]|nr:thermonuclease family protein [Methylococcales bacterium]
MFQLNYYLSLDYKALFLEWINYFLENPHTVIYLLLATIVMFWFIRWVIQFLSQRRDPLPEKLSNCIWHTKIRKIDRIYDGDTFFAYVKGHNPIDKKPVGIRIRGIDTPEMRDKNPRVKKKALKAKELAIEEIKNARKIHLYNVNTNDKYGRLLATVFCDRRDLAKILLEKKLAKPYDGGKKTAWKR